MISVSHYELYNHFDEIEESVSESDVKINVVINSPTEEELGITLNMIEELGDNVEVITIINANVDMDFPLDTLGTVEIFDSNIHVEDILAAGELHIVNSTISGVYAETFNIEAISQLTVSDSTFNGTSVRANEANIVRSEFVDTKVSQSEDDLGRDDPEISITNSVFRTHNSDGMTIDGNIVKISGSSIIGRYRVVGMTVVLNGVNFNISADGQGPEVKARELINVKTDLANAKLTKM